MKNILTRSLLLATLILTLAGGKSSANEDAIFVSRYELFGPVDTGYEIVYFINREDGDLAPDGTYTPEFLSDTYYFGESDTDYFDFAAWAQGKLLIDYFLTSQSETYFQVLSEYTWRSKTYYEVAIKPANPRSDVIQKRIDKLTKKLRKARSISNPGQRKKKMQALKKQIRRLRSQL